MRVAIMGAGISGTWLAARLKMLGLAEVDLFDRPGAKLGCACAWGTEKNEFIAFMYRVNVSPWSLIVRDVKAINFQNVVSLPTDNFCSINRPAMIRAILKEHGLKVITDKPDFSKYDRVIDCTGHARAFLPEPDHDLKIVTRQVIARHDALNPDEVLIAFGRVGYYWAFPLWTGGKAGNQWHIGWGELGDPAIVESWMKTVGFGKVACDCDWHFKEKECVRLAPPSVIGRFFGGVPRHPSAIRSYSYLTRDAPYDYPDPGFAPVWGCGESVGCVSPIVGEGIIPSLVCAELLLDNWTDHRAYKAAVLDEFAWMNREYEAIQHFLHGREWRGVLAFLRCLQNGQRFGLKVTWRNYPAILRVVWAWRRSARRGAP